MSNEHVDTAYPKIDLFELLRGLVRSCRLLLVYGILLSVAFSALLCYRTYRSYTPQYQATASFTVQVTNPLYANQQYYNASVAEQMAKTFPYILTSGVLSQQVRDTLNISYMPPVSAMALGNTNIFTLTVTSGDPQLAYDVLECVIDIYPSVAEFVVGPTTLTLFNESGVPGQPMNQLSFVRPITLGIMMGVVLWLAGSLLYWLTHRTVNSEEELGKLVNLPRLGSMPAVRGYGKRKGQCPMISDNNDKFGFSESIRLLRVRVEKAMAEHDGQVLIVTSTIANEGKSTISINLATALAQKGKKTLLVDCDLRNPSIAEAFGTKISVGLTEYLRGICDMKDVFHKMDTENLYVVFGGKPASNLEQMLGSKALREFLRESRLEYDYIILDTPPCALMADAAEIGRLADCALLTVRQGFAGRQHILEGVQVLEDSGKPIIGCVLNMTTPQISKGNYYNYYGEYGRRSSRS